MYKFDNFEITSWNQFSFKNILTKNFYVEHGSESTSLGEFRIDDFKIDKKLYL